MVLKVVFITAVITVARAGLLDQPDLTYASPLGYASLLSYATPVTKTVAPLSYTPYLSTKIVSPLAYSTPLSYTSPSSYATPHSNFATIDTDYDPNPQYSYSYDVQDGLTGDSKSQHESRSGNVVQGSYSLIDADGLQRTVDYTADTHNGFNAVVRREPIGHAVKAVAYSVPVYYY